MKRTNETIQSQAEALNPDEVKEVKVEVSLAVHNAELGAEALEPHEDVLRVVYRSYVSTVVLLRALITALVEATHAVESARIPLGARALFSRVYADREILLAQMTSWSLLGFVPPHELERVRSSRGPIAAGRAVLDMVERFSRTAEAKKRCLVSQATLAQMKANAEQMLAVVTPSGRRRRANAALTKALDTQARVWTLFVRQHDLLWRDAVRIFGRTVDDHVPALGSRVVTKRKVDEPAPVS